MIECSICTNVLSAFLTKLPDNFKCFDTLLGNVTHTVVHEYMHVAIIYSV